MPHPPPGTTASAGALRRDPVRQVVYLTEDAGADKFRPFRPNEWGDQPSGVLEAAVVSGSTVTWTTSISSGAGLTAASGVVRQQQGVVQSGGEQIAERALWLARAAVDDLAEFPNGEVAGLRDPQMHLGTHRPMDEDASRWRETWERHAALQLLAAASYLEPGDDQ